MALCLLWLEAPSITGLAIGANESMDNAFAEALSPNHPRQSAVARAPLPERHCLSAVTRAPEQRSPPKAGFYASCNNVLCILIMAFLPPYALSFRGHIHVCGGGIAGLPVAGFVWTTGYAVRSDVLDSTVSPIFAM